MTTEEVGAAAHREFPAVASASDIVAATPSSRDRFIDLMRAFAIVSVVVGHWTMAVVHWGNGQVSGENALALIKGAWIGTWIFQVMPLFFFVGGFANATTLHSSTERGRTYADYIKGRMNRLLRPVTAFVVVWTIVGVVLPLAGISGDTLNLAAKAVAQPLWFIGAYSGVIALAPVMVRLHGRYRLRALIGLALAAGLVDAARFGFHRPVIGLLNYLLVWLFAQQMGFFYADGSLLRLPRLAYGAMTVGGLLALTGLGVRGPYPSSMVGVAVDPISNMDPPTIVIVALAVWQVGFAMLLRPGLTRWLERPRAWMGVVFLNMRIMTIFLWHLPAMVLGILIAMALGFPQPGAGTWEWWGLRPPWVGLLIGTLIPFVALFGRFERPSSRPAVQRARASNRTERRSSDVLAAVAVLYAGMAVLGYAVTGFSPLLTTHGESLFGLQFDPLMNGIHLIAAAAMLRAISQSPKERGSVTRNLAIAFLALAALGVAAILRPSINVLSLNGGDDVLHLATAAILFWLYRTDRASLPSEAGAVLDPSAA